MATAIHYNVTFTRYVNFDFGHPDQDTCPITAGFCSLLGTMIMGYELIVCKMVSVFNIRIKSNNNAININAQERYSGEER